MKIGEIRIPTVMFLSLLPVFVGCGDALTSVSPDPLDDGPTPQMAALGQPGVLESANGTGHSARPDGSVNVIAFNAVKQVDGAVTGQLILQNRYFDTRLKMTIDCLAIDGNVAVMSGVSTQFTFPQFVGVGVWFVVEDNGEGVNAPPDRATGVYAFDDYLAHPDYCHEIIAHLEAWVPPPGAVVGWTTVIRGNVQVKGAGEP